MAVETSLVLIQSLRKFFCYKLKPVKNNSTVYFRYFFTEAKSTK